MKRPLAVLLCMAALLIVGAQAQAGALYSVTEPLYFRTHKATAGTGETLKYSPYLNLDAACVDSSIAMRVGAQAAVLCTTTVVNTRKFCVPQVSGAALDTMTNYLIIHIADACEYNNSAANCQASMDSIMVAAQGSINGVDWVTLGTFKAGTPASLTSRLDQKNGTGTFFGLATQSSTAYPVWQHCYKMGILSANQTSDVFSIHRWPLLRFVVGFLDAGGYKVRGSLTHYEGCGS